MEKLLDLIYDGQLTDWTQRCRDAYDELFGSAGGRYPERARKSVTLRAPEFRTGSGGVPFAALIDPSNPDSGAYGGMSFVIFSMEDRPALLSMVIGTQGLSPDEEVLGRPGHGRKVAAICNWLNKQYGRGKMVAWAKQDPARIDLDMQGTSSNYSRTTILSLPGTVECSMASMLPTRTRTRTAGAQRNASRLFST